MSTFLTSDDFPYPGDPAFTFDRALLRSKLVRHQSDFRDPVFLAVLQPFLNNPHGSDTALRCAILSLLRDAWKLGQFVLFRRDARESGDGAHDKLLVLDLCGVEWYFVKADNAYDTYRFDTAFSRVTGKPDPLTRAAIVLRRRFLDFTRGAPAARHEHADGTWSDFRFGWAAFWRLDWQPPVPRTS